MTIKFTKTGVGAEEGIETLLFEFRDEECPKELSIEYESALATNQYVGSLQTNQLQGIYLQPITWSGNIYGGCLDINNYYMTAKERIDELDRLQGRVVKFWYEGIKQLVIIKKLKYTYKGYNDIDYEITLQPHDIQIAIKPSDQDKIVQENLILISDDITKGMPKPPSGNIKDLTRMITKGLEVEDKKARLLLLQQEKVKILGAIDIKQRALIDITNMTTDEIKRTYSVPPLEKLNEVRADLAKSTKELSVVNKGIKELENAIKFDQQPKKVISKPLILNDFKQKLTQ